MIDVSTRTWRRRGAARFYAIVGVAAVAVVAALVIYSIASRPTPPPTPETVESERTKAAPEVAAVQERMFDAIRNRKSLAPSVEAAAKLVEKYPRSPDARVTYAQALMHSGRGQEAYDQLAESLVLDPSSASIHEFAGSTALKLNRPAEAQKHYSQAVGLEPRNAEYRLRLAAAFLAQDRYDEARDAALQALRIDSNLHLGHSLLSDVYAQQGRLGPALDQIDRALALSPSDKPETAYVYLRKKAKLQLRDNKPDAALATLRELPVKELVTPAVSEELSRCWMMLGQPNRAAAHYEQVLMVNPVADWAAERAAHFRIQAGDLDKARENIATLRRINPRAEEIHELEAKLAQG